MSIDLNQEFDVVIVGAGIAGATVAKSIIEAGGDAKKIVILEAGRNTGMSADKYLSHVLAFQEAEAKLPNSPYADNPNAPQPSEASLEQLVSQPTPNTKPISKVESDNGYMVQKGPLPFSSSYTRALGGTTLHWLGTCLRMLPSDFKLKKHFGHGVDWPIDYLDLKPYYERAETDIIGVSGDVANQFYPGIDPSYFGDYEYPMEEVPSSYLDQYLAERIDDTVVSVDHADFTVKVSNTPVGRNSTPRGKYKPVGAVGNASQGHRCEGNSSCIPICPVQAKYNALKTLSALQRDYGAESGVESGGSQSGSGSSSDSTVEIVAQTVASDIHVDDEGLISGITCKQYKEEASPAYTEVTVRGKVYVLAAHAIENAKLMLASNVANSSGQVGRNLMDHPLILTWGLLPDKIWSFRGPGSTSGIPAFRDGEFRKEHSAFRVEIGNWGWSFAAGAPNSTFEAMLHGSDDPEQPVKPLWGRKLRERMGEVLPRQFRIAWEFEQIPEESNFVTIDDNYRDALGNHRPVIHYDLPEYVKAAMHAARDASHQVFDSLGLKPLYEDDTGKPKQNPVAFESGWDYTKYDTNAPGYVTYKGKGYAYEGAGHLAGTHRMGSKAGDSVVNKHQQSWDHANLFTVGCGNMPTIGTSNPTLTMTALAIQAGENINKYLEGEL